MDLEPDRLPIGTRLTRSRALAAELEVSPSAVTDAYERLAVERHVEGRRGGGTVVEAVADQHQ